MKKTVLPFITWLMTAFLAIPIVANSQEGETSESPAQCPMFPSPVRSGIIGQKDASAEQEINNFLHSGSTRAWHDLEASGSLEFPAGDSHSSTLYLLGTDFSRLDISMDSATRSIRSHGARGSFQNEKGDEESLLPITARSGVVVLPLLWSDPLRSQYLSIRDDGLTKIGDRALHRITLEYPLNVGIHENGNPTTGTDLYFDPATHDLIYSVDTQFFPNAGKQPFQRVTSYAGYQSFDGLVMPTNIQQFLGGQPLWSFQVTQATVNSNIPVNTFVF